ncbi:MAG: tetratricopeptide repeat protein, partial [bacterium]
VFNTNTGNTREMKAQLYKMLKDDKNIEYRDQIYYALGNIAYKEGNLEEAIKNYQTSIRESMGNNNQISLSYKTIADIYYQQPQYEKAQAYYDSTLAFLSQDHQEYNIIFDRAKLLNKLVDYNNTIIVQDSLLRIAKMDEKERLALIDKAISDVIYQEQLIREKAAREQQEQSYNRSILNENNYRGTSNTNTGGKWYFYNPGGKGFGQAEFKMKWGTRELEDNWRRKNKKSMASSVELLADSEEEDTMDPKKGLDSKSREYYLLDIPMSDSAQEKSHLKIQKAYYNKALLYRNDLNESDLALEAFKELTRKYPESEFAVSSYYNIYQIYQVKGDKEKENIYKNIIINNYPNSNYAKLLTDPTYIKKLEEKEKEVLNFYMATYEKYKNKMYHDVIKDTDYAIAKFSKNPLIPKFMYLKALSVGYLYDDDVLFKQNLDELIAKYPNDDVSQQAMETIEYLANTSQEVIKEIEKQEEIIAKEIYSYNPDTIHYFAFSVKRSTDVDQLTFNIINYNIDHYEESNLSSSGEELFGEYNIVYVKGFKTALEAQNYMKKLIVNNTIYRDVEKENLEPFVISPLNLITLKEDKQLDRYFKFYKAFYKK